MKYIAVKTKQKLFQISCYSIRKSVNMANVDLRLQPLSFNKELENFFWKWRVIKWFLYHLLIDSTAVFPNSSVKIAN